ncbi:MAG: ABC transporter permease [Beijerinckiaceae bacterium]|jgi:putative spermidine/putrescine transport system permease protein|nr:ABC transporter permease [Beijerinckiaceae bacterium]
MHDPAESIGHRAATTVAMVLPTAILVVTGLVLPLLLLLRFSFNHYASAEGMVDAFTFENYASLITDPFFRDVLFSTLIMATVTTGFCLLGGLPVGYFIARLTSRRLKTLMILVVLLPLLIGSAARTAGWLILLGDRGLLNSIFLAWGLRASPLTMVYTPFAVVIGLVSVLLPFMIISLQSVFENIDVSLEEASRSLGSPPLKTFFRIVLPIALPGVVAGSLFCFVLSMNAYATPRLLGGPQFRTVSTEMYQQITQQANWPMGSALAFVLMTLTLVSAALPPLLARARRVATS